MSTQNLIETNISVPVFPTQDINGATLSEDYVSLENYEGVTIIINVGAAGGTSAVTLTQATAVAGTGEKALSFDNQWSTVAGVQTKNTVTSNTFDILATDDDTIFKIYVSSSSLDVDGGFDCVRLDMTDPTVATLVGAQYVMTGARYAGATQPNPTVD